MVFTESENSCSFLNVKNSYAVRHVNIATATLNELCSNIRLCEKQTKIKTVQARWVQG